MAREVKEVTIDGEKYTFTQLGAVKSHRLLRRIGAIVAPIFGNIIGSKEEKKGLDALLDADIGKAFDNFFEKASEVELDYIVFATLQNVIHHGSGNLNDEVKIDNHFAGRVSHMYKVIWEYLKFEYNDFFTEGGILGNLNQKAQTGSQKKK